MIFSSKNDYVNVIIKIMNYLFLNTNFALKLQDKC